MKKLFLILALVIAAPIAGCQSTGSGDSERVSGY